jgi:hypothetical protein
MVLRRKSLGSSTAGKTQYGRFWKKYSRTYHVWGNGDSIHVFYQPLP